MLLNSFYISVTEGGFVKLTHIEAIDSELTDFVDSGFLFDI